jgi:hypothetical protein
MKCYAIVKVGNDYVVEVDHLRVMKFTSRRKALRLVAEAAVLLDEARAAAQGE